MPTDSFNEHSVVCDKTAFKYYRTPPRYLGACPAPPLFEPDPRYRKLRTAPPHNRSAWVTATRPHR